jgi:hypothetical protein
MRGEKPAGYVGEFAMVVGQCDTHSQGLPLGRRWPVGKSVLKSDDLPTGWSVGTRNRS